MNTAAEDLWARVNALAVERDSLRAELETAKKERDDLKESEALLDGHCNAHIAERDEAVLKLSRLTKFLVAKSSPEEEAFERAEVVGIRAVAFEEAARALVPKEGAALASRVLIAFCQGAIRALAPLDPALVAVPVEVVARVLTLLGQWLDGGQLHDHDDGCPEDDCCDCSNRPLADNFNATYAALAALAAGR